MKRRNIIDCVIILIFAIACVLQIVWGLYRIIYTEHKNVIICETDLLQSCKTYRNVEVMDSTVNHIVIRNNENTFTLMGRILKYE